MIDTLKVTKKELFNEFKKIAKQHDVKLSIKRLKRASGTYTEEENKIMIDSSLDKKSLPFVFFHELGHLHCVRNKIWKTYHDFNNTWQAYKATALKAEKWIDSWAEKEVVKYFKNVNSYKPYHKESCAQEFREMVNTVDYNYWVLKNENTSKRNKLY